MKNKFFGLKTRSTATELESRLINKVSCQDLHDERERGASGVVDDDARVRRREGDGGTRGGTVQLQQ